MLNIVITRNTLLIGLISAIAISPVAAANDAAIKRGYVAVNVGYIKGLNIHPQAQRDFKTLVRWL